MPANGCLLKSEAPDQMASLTPTLRPRRPSDLYQPLASCAVGRSVWRTAGSHSNGHHKSCSSWGCLSRTSSPPRSHRSWPSAPHPVLSKGLAKALMCVCIDTCIDVCIDVGIDMCVRWLSAHSPTCLLLGTPPPRRLVHAVVVVLNAVPFTSLPSNHRSQPARPISHRRVKPWCLCSQPARPRSDRTVKLCCLAQPRTWKHLRL